MAHDVFLSYSHKDKVTADAVSRTLEVAGIRVWMAPRDIVPGAEWGESIILAINSVRAVVLVFSRHANGSRQVRLEIERAINRGLPVIPFRIENVAPSASLELFISSSHWLEAYTPPLERHLQSLTESLAKLLGIKLAPDEGSNPTTPSPARKAKSKLGLAAAGVTTLVVIGGMIFVGEQKGELKSSETPSPPIAPDRTNPLPAPVDESQALQGEFDAAEEVGTTEALEAFLRKHPNGPLANVAKRAKSRLQAAAAPRVAEVGDPALIPAQEWVGCGPDRLGVAREISIDPGAGLSLGLQSYPHTLQLADHEVVLTFDDGPAATTTQALDALRRECAKATFFIIGRNAEAMPQIVRREVQEGHSVGYHSMTNPERTLRLMDTESAKADIDAGIAAVDKAGFGAAGDRPKSAFFRFPGYADTPELLDFAHGRGLAVFGSDVWASDWRNMTPQEELKLVMDRLEKAGKGIVQFHDSKASTVKMLPDFLRALKERGFKLVHMKPGAGPTPVTASQPDWTSTIEPILRKVLGAKRKAEDKAQEPHRHDDGGM